MRFLKKGSAITRCPLCRVFGRKKTTEIKMEDVFHAIRVNCINKILLLLKDLKYYGPKVDQNQQ